MFKHFNLFFDKINISEIVKAFLSSLTSANTNKPSFSDYFSFLLFPIIISVILIFCDILINQNSANIIITVLSIFVGLLINTLVIIITFLNANQNEKSSPLFIRIYKNLSSQIAFNILLCIITIIFVYLSLIDNCYVNYIFSAISYFFLLLIILIITKIIISIFHKINFQLDKMNST